MKENKEINVKTEEVLEQISSVTDSLYGRVKKIDFTSDVLFPPALEDLKLHLGYARMYSDLAKVRLNYIRFQ